jgi:hypothetical protein
MWLLLLLLVSFVRMNTLPPSPRVMRVSSSRYVVSSQVCALSVLMGNDRSGVWLMMPPTWKQQDKQHQGTAKHSMLIS